MSQGRFIAREKGAIIGRRARIDRLIQERPGAVLTALAQLPAADLKQLAWVTRRLALAPVAG